MPVQLPNAPACPTPLPAQPQNPPTLIDIADAIEYNRIIRISRMAGVATKSDVARGAIYEAAIIEENAGNAVAPPWFGPAIGAAIGAAIAPLLRVTHATYNLLCGDGHSRPFQVVPFTNGDDPTNPPHNLPALNNVGNINTLTGPEAAAYLNGYNKPVPHQIHDRKEAIRVEIGCTVEL